MGGRGISERADIEMSGCGLTLQERSRRALGKPILLLPPDVDGSKVLGRVEEHRNVRDEAGYLVDELRSRRSAHVNGSTKDDGRRRRT